MGAKLGVEATTLDSSRSISEIGAIIAINWDRFRAIAERDALFIIAMAQSKRDAQRQVWVAEKAQAAADSKDQWETL